MINNTFLRIQGDFLNAHSNMLLTSNGFPLYRDKTAYVSSAKMVPNNTLFVSEHDLVSSLYFSI